MQSVHPEPSECNQWQNNYSYLLDQSQILLKLYYYMSKSIIRKEKLALIADMLSKINFALIADKKILIPEKHFIICLFIFLKI